MFFYHGFFCGDYNHRFSQNLGTDFHNIVMIRALFFVLLDDFGGVGPVGRVRRIAARVSNLSGRAAVWLSGLFCFLGEFYADGSWHFYGVAGGREGAGFTVSLQHFDVIVVAAGYEQIFAVGRDDKVAWMNAGFVIAHFR